MTWTLTDITTLRDNRNQPRFYLFHVSNPVVASDAPATLDPADVYFGFGSQVIQIAETTETTKRVWARQEDRGSLAGVLTAGTGEEGLIQGAAATATFLIRWESALANGDSIEDDLGRIWNVFQTASIQNRRYLQLDAQRSVLEG